MVIKMACLFPAGCEITDGWVKKITNEDPTNYYGDDTGSNYNPANDISDTSDPPPYTPYNTIPDNDSTTKLYDDDAAIILNPDEVDHHGPITGLETNHNHDNIHNNEEPPEAEPPETEADLEPPGIEPPEEDYFKVQQPLVQKGYPHQRKIHKQLQHCTMQ